MSHQNIITMTKVVELSEIVTICEQNKQTGDVYTLSKMFNMTTDAIRMRISRKDERTYRALYIIVCQREQLINDFKNHQYESTN